MGINAEYMGEMLSDLSAHTMLSSSCYLLCLLVTVASVRGESTEDGEARVGYYSINSAGASTLTFNATSIQNGVLLGFLVLVLGALILPLFGVNLLASDEYTSASTDSASYGEAYSNFAKRTGLENLVGPVMSALHKGKKRYEDEDEN